MARLFTETFFKKNHYFRKQIGLSIDQIRVISKKFENWKENCITFNPDSDKESSDENAFTKLIFQDVLDFVGKSENSQNYHIFPKFTIEGAGASGKSGFVDLALGYFSKIDQLSTFDDTEKSNLDKKKEYKKVFSNTAQILVEFKDMKSSNLDLPSNRKDKLSPINQCWNYLNCYPHANWGIVTNFNEIRIYNKAKGKNYYEVFYFVVPIDLTDRYKSLTEETEILKFISILRCSHILQSSLQANSFTEDMLFLQVKEEEKVQKDFYYEYKELRIRIFNKLLGINIQYNGNKTQLLQLVQKLLDRVIFCWFCEDSRTGLLPSNIFSKEVIGKELDGKYYNDNDDDIYSKVKNLFKAIDVGGNFNIVDGYNGELFKENKDLDNLIIPNYLFKDISEIGSKYDFGDENELNVNILGHIFEQSISDLEELRVTFQEYVQKTKSAKENLLIDHHDQNKSEKKIEVLEHEYVPFDPKKSKRKKEGVFYTPDYITAYIVEQTIGVWLKDKRELIEKKYSNLKKNVTTQPFLKKKVYPQRHF